MRLFLIAVALVGCAKKDTTLSAADSQSAGQALAAEVEDSASGYGPVATQSAAPACVTLTGDTTDPDADSIPTNATLTFNCTNTELGYTGTLTGTEMVTDTEPNTAAWAFSANADLHAALTGPAGASLTVDRKGSIAATQTGAAGPFGLARSLDVTTVLTGAGVHPTSITVDQTNAWTITYTPTLTWMPGSVVVGGTLDATGSWVVSVGDAQAEASIATPTPLTVSPSCNSRVTAGVVVGTYPDGANEDTITVTWTGCGISTVTFAGG